MPPLVRRDIWFDSADGHSKIAGYIYSNPYVAPFCVLQISHGMCEYIRRYEEFATFLTSGGIAVCGNDHLGHGASVQNEKDLGYYYNKDGRMDVLSDMHTMNQKIHEVFPKLPVVLLGHSMGSFYARRYATKWPSTIEGLIISGTAGTNIKIHSAISMVNGMIKMLGMRHRSRMVDKMAFANYQKRIPNPRTPSDWLSRDEKIVDAYRADPLCTFRFTLSGFSQLFAILQEVSGEQWASTIRKNMPIMMIQGSEDPVGDYANGTNEVRKILRKAGVSNVEYITYQDARHEVLNETNRYDVYEDVLAYLKRWWKH